MSDGANVIGRVTIDPAAGPPRLDKPKQPVHPSQDSSETAKELVRAAAYTLDAETFRSVHLAVVCPPRGAGRHREGADQADRDRGARDRRRRRIGYCIPP